MSSSCSPSMDSRRWAYVRRSHRDPYRGLEEKGPLATRRDVRKLLGCEHENPLSRVIDRLLRNPESAERPPNELVVSDAMGARRSGVRSTPVVRTSASATVSSGASVVCISPVFRGRVGIITKSARRLRIRRNQTRPAAGRRWSWQRNRSDIEPLARPRRFRGPA